MKTTAIEKSLEIARTLAKGGILFIPVPVVAPGDLKDLQQLAAYQMQKMIDAGLRLDLAKAAADVNLDLLKPIDSDIKDIH